MKKISILLEMKNLLQYKIYDEIFNKIMSDLKNNYPCDIIDIKQKQLQELASDLDDVSRNKLNLFALKIKINQNRIYE